MENDAVVVAVARVRAKVFDGLRALVPEEPEADVAHGRPERRLHAEQGGPRRRRAPPEFVGGRKLVLHVAPVRRVRRAAAQQVEALPPKRRREARRVGDAFAGLLGAHRQAPLLRRVRNLPPRLLHLRVELRGALEECQAPEALGLVRRAAAAFQPGQDPSEARPEPHTRPDGGCGTPGGRAAPSPPCPAAAPRRDTWLPCRPRAGPRCGPNRRSWRRRGTPPSGRWRPT